jgi:signal transduction histidine kinase
MVRGSRGGDNGTVQERGLIRRAVAFFGEAQPLRRAETRRNPGWSDRAVDTAIAVVATIAAVWSVVAQIWAGRGDVAVRAVPGPTGGEIVTLGRPSLAATYFIVLGAMLTTAPLAFRRWYPAGAFCVIMVAVLATNRHTTAVTFATVLFAAYSAIVYSRYRRLALLCVFAVAVIVTAAFPDTTPRVPARFTALLVLLPTVAVAVAMRTWRRRAGDSAERLRRAEAGHEAQTRRAVEAERARIASELHDVVTHNVSVMVVQAGAARRVLGSSPEQGREAQTAMEALLAVEGSGRTAMGELRHLLGLLAPAALEENAAEENTGEAALVPQPGLAQAGALVDRVRAAGLPAELVTEGTGVLPPGVDLAAYRVVQESLTNVLKHGGGARAVVRLVYGEGKLVITVTDTGGPAGYGPPGSRGSRDPGGRGLIGLRERLGLYGGELDAGPRPGGGWRVRATIPLEPA